MLEDGHIRCEASPKTATREDYSLITRSNVINIAKMDSVSTSNILTISPITEIEITSRWTMTMEVEKWMWIW
jgi:hypothetical protein